MKYFAAAMVMAFILDGVFGDPYGFPHPIIYIGKLIGFLDKKFRSFFPDTPGDQIGGGVVLWFIVVLLSAGIPFGILWFLGRLHPYLRLALETFWCYQLLAARSLKTESMKVYKAVKNENIERARFAVSMIVGRDTEKLSMEGVIKAAVETVAENTSDGVIAPLFYMAIGGAPLAFFYKAVNTMDSMIAYKNEKYLYFGRFAAWMDDIFNYIPARISAILMILGTLFLRLDTENALNIFLRDRHNHASPNSAQTESVCAGALRVQLAGDAYYFGELHKKPFIGDPFRKVEAEDIPRANRLMYAAASLAVVLFAALSFVVFNLL